MSPRSLGAHLALGLALAAALSPQLAAASQWGSGYGDPAGFCPAQSWLPRSYLSLPVTNDPSVPANPEAATFFGYHASPGYDDWFGYWYGDFRGRPGDASGWQKIMRVYYPGSGRWNFSSWGWAVHGHAKQYIAYYNWTFGGQCGLGWYGSPSPAPYMADVDGWPVVDVYVDSVAPPSPPVQVTALSPASVSFGWQPVADRGDGAGADLVTVGMGSYSSWVTVGSGTPIDRLVTASPVPVTVAAAPGQQVCLHVTAADLLGNTSPASVACATPAGTPPVPPPPAPAAVAANPVPGLAGLAGWFWLQPSPATVTTLESAGGVSYRVVAQPVSADWTFGDGASLPGAGFGLPYPQPSPVQHVFQAESASGYPVAASVNYQLEWWYQSGGAWSGPYPLGVQSVNATTLSYPVEQAQPELLVPG